MSNIQNNTNSSEINKISVYDINKLITSNSKLYVIIDVREESSYLVSHISSAINIPYDILINKLRKSEIRIDKSKKIIVYCEHGGRSIYAARELSKYDYEAYTIVGGYAEYKKLKLS